MTTPPRLETTPTPSLFHVEWLVPLDVTGQDDLTRAVAEKADALLRAAAFIGRDAQQEVRVWVDAAAASACVSVTFEPRSDRHGFYLLDDTLTQRLACVVFDDVASIGAPESEQQLVAILDAMRELQRSAAASVRVPVKEKKRRRHE